MKTFKASLIGVSVLAIVAVIQTDVSARSEHHESHGRSEASHNRPNESATAQKGGQKDSQSAAESAEPHIRKPLEGSDLSKEGDVATRNAASGAAGAAGAAGDVATTRNAAGTAAGDVATRNAAGAVAGDVATRNTVSGGPASPAGTAAGEAPASNAAGAVDQK
jgi:hypothetical protein